MKRLSTLIMLVGAVGAFFSGFVYWMANSSHQDAERLRQQGRYAEVEVLGKRSSSPGDGSSTFHYIDVKALDLPDAPRRMTCSVGDSTYEDLHVGQKLKAWVLGTDALLDYGPKNAGSVAHTMFLTCIGFGLVMLTGVTLRTLSRTSGLSQ